jgi:hypothetical protein
MGTLVGKKGDNLFAESEMTAAMILRSKTLSRYQRRFKAKIAMDPS